MLIAGKSVILIASNHCKNDYSSEFRERSFSWDTDVSGSFVLPYKFECTIFPASFGSVRLVYFVFFISIIASFKITGIKSAKICPEMRVKELGGITCELKNDILKAHNDVRQAVAAGLAESQPAASNMHELYWDEELAEGAQEWANHCVFKHNEPIDRKIGRFQVGQNIAITKNRGKSSDVKEFRRQVKNWFDEHAVYTFGVINENLQSIGHYTQLVWADTYLVGCGFSRFEEAVRNVSYRLYVCHYGPTGNVQDEEPYKTGSKKCPKDTVPSRKYNALCALTSPPRNNCSKSLEQPKRKEQQEILVNARRSKWLQNLQTTNGADRRVKSGSLLPVRYQDDNIDPFGSEGELTLIIFKLIIKMR